MEGAEMPPYSFQDLRRSEGTFLVLLMIQPRVAQRYMGNPSTTTTMNVYAQAPTSSKRTPPGSWATCSSERREEDPG